MAYSRQVTGETPYPKRTRLPRHAYGNRDTVFHITIHAHPDVSQFVPSVRDAVWQVVIEQVDGRRIELVTACLMPDHLHLLLQAAGMDVLGFVRSFKSWTTRRSWAAGHAGPLWQPGMWDRSVRGPADFAKTLAYVYENPVRAGLVAEAVDRPWTYIAPRLLVRAGVNH